MRNRFDRVSRLLYVRAGQRLAGLRERMRADGGMSTLEMLGLVTMLLLAAAAFTVAFNGKLQELISEFKSS